MNAELAERAWHLTHCGLLARDVAVRLGVKTAAVFTLLDAHAPIHEQREYWLALGEEGRAARIRGEGPRQGVRRLDPAAAYRMLASGEAESVSDVADMVDVHSETVRRAVKHYAEVNGLPPVHTQASKGVVNIGEALSSAT